MSNIYDEFDESINLGSSAYYSLKYKEALEKSIKRDVRLATTRIKYQKRQDAKKSVARTALAAALSVAFAVSGYAAKGQAQIKKARDYQRQLVITSIENGQTTFTPDQMLGLMEIFGDEKGVELATGQNWKDYCKRKGYVEVVHVSESGTYVETMPSLKVLKNYLETEALKNMNEIKQNKTENSNDGGKTI